MCKVHPSFAKAPPANWNPQAGEKVRVLFRGRTYEGVVTQVLDSPRAFQVASDDLLLPVVCDRDDVRPLETPSPGEA